MLGRVAIALAVLASLGSASPGSASPGLAPTAPAVAAPLDEPADAHADAVPGPTGVAFLDQTDWLEEGEVFDLWVEVGDDVAPEDALVVDLHAPVTSRSQFQATLRGDLLRNRLAEYVVPIGELTTGPGRTRRLRLTPEPSDAPGARLLRALPRAGVYPMVVGLRPDDADVEPPAPFVTYLVATPSTGTTPLRVAVLQPVASNVALQVDGTVELPPDELDRLAALAEVLARSADTPMTLKLRPETIEALRLMADGLDVSDESGPGGEQARDVLAELEAAAESRQVVSAPFVDVTVDALEATGLGDELAVQRRRGDDALRDALGITPAPGTWVAEEGLGPAALARLEDLGVERLVVPDEALDVVQLRLTLTRPFSVTAGGRISSLEVTAAEPALAAHHLLDDPVLGAQQLLADLAVLQGDEPGPLRPRGVVVAPPPGVRTDPAFLAELLDGVADSPILEPVTLDSYFEAVPAEGEPGEALVRTLAPSGGRLSISAGDVADARGRLDAFAGLVEGGAAPESLSDQILVAEADGLTPGERRRRLAGVPEEIQRRVGSVSVVDSTTFRLPDSEGTIPLTLVRDGSAPLSVRVVLESDKLEFEDADGGGAGRVSYDVELASENTPLVVPVQVRSPGTFPLLVTVTSPDGRLELVRAQLTIRSTAFSGVGVALSAGAGLFLLLWWARHWRTVRRARDLVPVG